MSNRKASILIDHSSCCIQSSRKSRLYYTYFIFPQNIRLSSILSLFSLLSSLFSSCLIPVTSSDTWLYCINFKTDIMSATLLIGPIAHSRQEWESLASILTLKVASAASQ